VVLPQGHSSNSSQCSGVRIPVWAASRPCSFACGYGLCPITAGSRLPRHGHNVDRHLQSAAGSLSRIFILPAYLRSHSFPFSVWLALRAEVARGNMTQQQALECLAMMQAASVPPSQEGVHGGGHSEAEHGLWPRGYQRLAAVTTVSIFVLLSNILDKLCMFVFSDFVLSISPCTVGNGCLVTSRCFPELLARTGILRSRITPVVKARCRSISSVKKWYAHSSLVRSR
jgi:hypothetical protein